MSQALCERCGEPLPEEARFCPNCGFPVGAPPTEERKLATVVFTDLVGSTQLSAQIDAERYREVVGAFYQAVTEELESLRGRAYNFAGDAVVGEFGIPTSHDDDALRAIRAGLSIVKRVERIGEAFGIPVPLRCRVGVNTGRVAIGAESAERGLLFGPVVNAAARLQQAAEPGAVQVGETTWMLTKDQVEFDDRREVGAKGFDEALPAWPVVALVPRSSRRTIPLVDRRRELRLITETFERAVEARRGHMVTLFGEPGIGKSRVADEFVAGLPAGTKVLTGRASPFEEDVTFGPLAQILLQEMGERPDASPERLRSRLEAVVAACCPADRVLAVAARLGLALGLGEEPRGGRRYRVAEIRSGLLSFFQGLSARGPIAMVVEDLHQAQPPLLDLLEQVVREAKELPLLLLCVARYHLLDDRPDWGGGLGDSLNLYLEPLSLADATDLALEAGERLDEETAERIARHAGGNPFFIVETTGMLMHAEAELSSDAEPLPRALLPPTVQAVIAERIDHLAPEARELVRKASVFARSTFDLTELALIAEPSEKVLELLEDEELLVREEEGADVWRFRHGLVRDVAYESLPKRARQRLHLRVADALAEDPETAARYPRSLAYHLEQAAKASLDLDPKDRTLSDRAVDALVRSADLARRRIDSRAAIDLYERALALAGPEREWSDREAWILSGIGEARYWLGEFDAAEVLLSRALKLASEDLLTVQAHAGRFLGDILLTVRGDREEAAHLFDQGLAAAKELGDPWTLARTLLSAGWVHYHGDELGEARQVFEQALETARSNPEGDPWVEARALVSMGVATTSVGDEEEVEGFMREALAIGQSMDDAFTVAVAEDGLGGSLRRMWRPDEALPLLSDAIRIHRELGAKWELANSLLSRGMLHRVAGRIEDAQTDVREALRLCKELKERSLITWAGYEMCRLLLLLGDVSAARLVIEEAAAQMGTAPPWAYEDLAMAETLLLLAEDDREEALRMALSQLDVERRRGWANEIASITWFIGRLFGADAVGGEDELERARQTLEAHHRRLVLIELLPVEA
ncbi:MAG: ATP-binding protein [Actinomycetota bacterium]